MCLQTVHEHSLFARFINSLFEEILHIKNSFCSDCTRTSIKPKQRTVLSEKTLFENLANTYNCIFLTYFRPAEPNDDISKHGWFKDNIVLIRGMYKRDTPVSVYREIFIYRSSSRNFFELEQCHWEIMTLPIEQEGIFCRQLQLHLQIESHDDHIVVWPPDMTIR